MKPVLRLRASQSTQPSAQDEDDEVICRIVFISSNAQMAHITQAVLQM